MLHPPRNPRGSPHETAPLAWGFLRSCFARVSQTEAQASEQVTSLATPSLTRPSLTNRVMEYPSKTSSHGVEQDQRHHFKTWGRGRKLPEQGCKWSQTLIPKNVFGNANFGSGARWENALRSEWATACSFFHQSPRFREFHDASGSVPRDRRVHP